MRQITLTEVDSWSTHQLDAAEQRLLISSGVIEIRPGEDDPGRWELRASGLVGAAKLEGFETCIDLRIAPKVPVARLLHLMSYSTTHDVWRDEWVDLPQSLDIPSAIAEALARTCRSALQAGLLQGYVTTDEAALTLRGRIRFGDQIRYHQGQAIPVEITYDEFTTDIVENQILKAAMRRMLVVPGLNQLTRQRLLAQVRRLGDVSDLVPGQPIPQWMPSRLNSRYRPALRLAELVLRGTTFDHGTGDVRVNGFLVSMHKVFEDFVTKALGDALVRSCGGRRVLQDSVWSLDRDARIRLRPDLVWYPEQRPLLPGVVVDAKYKAEKISGFPQSDVYQMLAYCTSLGLREGHLVYAAGNEDGARYVIPIGDSAIEVFAHTLDLALDADALNAQIDELALLMTSRPPPGSPTTSGREFTYVAQTVRRATFAELLELDPEDLHEMYETGGLDEAQAAAYERHFGIPARTT